MKEKKYPRLKSILEWEGGLQVYKPSSNQQMTENLWPHTKSNCDMACDSKGPKAKPDDVGNDYLAIQHDFG